MAKSPKTFTSHSPPRARTLSGPATGRRLTRELLQTRNRAFGPSGVPTTSRQTSATRTDTTSKLPISLGSTNKRYEPSSRAGVISYQAAASFRSNDGEQLRAAVLAGLGITQAPYWLFAAGIRAGTVRRVLRDREPARIPISAVRPASRRQPSKVAVFVDFLAELLAETDD